MMEHQTIEDIQLSLRRFGTLDYVVFCGMLLICVFIGLYYAFWGKDKTKSNEDEYLMGGRNMKILPVSFSLVATLISGISLLGIPTELYVYGTQYSFTFIGVFMMGFITTYVFIPVLHELHLSSTYEYLELRFDKKVRTFGSLTFALSLVIWLPIVIYVPALAFNQVTGVNVHVITPCVCLVCIFYTCIGGLKAVVWTDLIQTCVMFCSVLIVVIKGTLDVGGLGVVWQRNYDTGRMEIPSFQLDFSDRHSMWSVTIGLCFLWVQVTACSQSMTQRYLALPTTRHAQKALLLFVIGCVCVLSVCMYAGLVAFATFYDCDPTTTKVAKAKDQILPVLVMKVLGNYPGMPGLFVSGVFSAALSSLSTGLNAMSAVVLEDFVKPIYKNLSPSTVNWIMKSVVVVLGLLSVVLVFVVERLGTVLQLSMSLGSVANASMIGIFICGVLVPWVNSKGCFIGGIFGVIVTSVIVFGAQGAIAAGKLTFPGKPVSVEGCDYIFNATNIVRENFNDDDSYVFPLFKISYLWYCPFGALVTVIVAIIVSYFTGFTKMNEINPSHVAPFMRKYLPYQVKEPQEKIKMLETKEIVQNMEDD